MESQKKFPVTYSFELFPPQTPEGIEKLRVTRGRLAQYHPKFFSVTFGAGGSTRERTLETVLELKAEGYVVAPHLSCIGSTRNNIREILEKYYQAKMRGCAHFSGYGHEFQGRAGLFSLCEGFIDLKPPIRTRIKCILLDSLLMLRIIHLLDEYNEFHIASALEKTLKAFAFVCL